MIITEWDIFRALDLGRLKAALAAPLLVDLRNIYRPEEMIRRGFTYVSVGRPVEYPSDDPDLFVGTENRSERRSR